MAPKMKSVFSSHVHKIGLDADTGELHVLWDGGRRSIYGDPEKPVPAALAEEVANSKSVGKALNDMIKGDYSHRYG